MTTTEKHTIEEIEAASECVNEVFDRAGLPRLERKALFVASHAVVRAARRAYLAGKKDGGNPTMEERRN